MKKQFALAMGLVAVFAGIWSSSAAEAAPWHHRDHDQWSRPRVIQAHAWNRHDRNERRDCRDDRRAEIRQRQRARAHFVRQKQQAQLAKRRYFLSRYY